MTRLRVRAIALAVAVAGIVVLAGCAPEGDGQATPSNAPTTSETPGASASPAVSPSPSGSPGSSALPTDCRSILSASVLAELAGVPLNDPSFGPSGARGDTLTCIWRDPAADTTSLVTTITRMSSGPALDLLNGLVASDGFTCFTPDKGTRCEKTFQNPTYGTTDGRTLFYREGLLIDTSYSNLAPSGYTSSIIERVFG